MLLSGYSVSTTPVVMSASKPPQNGRNHISISGQVANDTDSKRKGSKDVGAAPITKRPRRGSITKQLALKGNPARVSLLEALFIL